jgi:hypothetical protein
LTVDDLAQHDAPVGMSSFFTVGGEHVNVTDEMVASIEGMVEEDWEADLGVIAGVVQSHDAWDEITNRGLTIGRLGFVGAAHYVLQGLAQEYNATAELVRHFTGRMDRYEKLMVEIVEARQRAERSRYILDGAVSVCNEQAETLAGAKHEELMRVYGSSRNRASNVQPASPGRKRKIAAKDPDAIRSLLKKARRNVSQSDDMDASRRSGLTVFTDTPPSSQQYSNSKPSSKDRFAAYTTPRNDETPSHRNSATRSSEKGKYQPASKPASKDRFAAYTTPRNEETPSHRNSAGHSGEKGKYRSAMGEPEASEPGDKRLRKTPTVQSFNGMLGAAVGDNNSTSPTFAEDMESLQD